MVPVSRSDNISSFHCPHTYIYTAFVTHYPCFSPLLYLTQKSESLTDTWWNKLRKKNYIESVIDSTGIIWCCWAVLLCPTEGLILLCIFRSTLRFMYLDQQDISSTVILCHHPVVTHWDICKVTMFLPEVQSSFYMHQVVASTQCGQESKIIVVTAIHSSMPATCNVLHFVKSLSPWALITWYDWSDVAPGSNKQLFWASCVASSESWNPDTLSAAYVYSLKTDSRAENENLASIFRYLCVHTVNVWIVTAGGIQTHSLPFLLSTKIVSLRTEIPAELNGASGLRLVVQVIN